MATLPTPPFPGASLRVGTTGANVRTIQEYLNIIGTGLPTLATDGIFGPRTEAAVIAFQRRFNLVPDGIVGPITWAEIMRQFTATLAPPFPGTSLRVGSTGANVRMIQERLNSIGTGLPALATDGIFGPRTEAAVIAFQRRFNLVPDGIVGPITWAEITRQFTSPSQPPPPPLPPQLNRLVVLDPGHGGSDPGAVLGTRREKDDVLRLALAVRQILQAQGQRVVMTRSTDVFVTLAERSAISNRNNANLFVSIHRNSSTNPAANGVENYIFTTAPTADALYAHNVLDEIVDAGVQNNRGVIRANFAVLRNTNAPSMLLEMGFITNVRDNQLFDQNFNAYAAAIARGIMTSLYGPAVPPPTYSLYTVVNGDSLPVIARRFGTTVAAIISLNKLTRDILITGQVLKIPR